MKENHMPNTDTYELIVFLGEYRWPVFIFRMFKYETESVIGLCSDYRLQVTLSLN